MTNTELQAGYGEIVGHINGALKKLEAMIGDKPPPMLSIQMYEASRRAEDLVARCNNCMAILSARTNEAVNEKIDNALGAADGKKD